MLVKDLQKGFLPPSALAALLAMTSVLYIRKAWKGDQQKSSVENYRKSFVGHILKGKHLLQNEFNSFFRSCIICIFLLRD